MQIIIALLVFSVIVVIHELGHFLLAKKNGITVTEFSVGMGPRLITVVKTDSGFTCKLFGSTDYCMNREDWMSHTKYSWKLLPIGGSCMMLGEDEDVADENAFNNKGVWARFSVIFGGPFFNFILAFVFALIVVGSKGFDKPVIVGITPQMEQQQNGVLVGDIIEKVNGTSIHLSREFSLYRQLEGIKGEEYNITVLRNGQKVNLTIPYLDADTGGKQYGFAISLERVRVGALGTVKYSFYEVKFWIEATIKSLGQMIAGKVSKDDISGPVGIVDMIGDNYNQSKAGGVWLVIINMLQISILLSANLGVMNLLPLPALDGGRLVFILIEAIRGKPIDREKEGMVHLIGLIALMVLMVFVMFNDFSRILK